MSTRLIQPGIRVRAADQNNIGEVVSIEGDKARVHFISPNGKEATPLLPVALLTPLSLEGHAEEGRSPRKPAVLISDFTSELLRLERRAKGLERPIPLPWPRIAENMRGGLWQPGAHVVVGTTGIGKTQFGMHVSLHAACQGIPVAYVALELDVLQILSRVVAYGAKARWSDLYLGKVTPGELQGVFAKVPGIHRLPLRIERPPPGGWPYTWLWDLAAEMREAYPEAEEEDPVTKEKKPIRGSKPFLIAVDFLQLVADADDGGRTDPRQRIGNAAYEATEVANEFDCAVLLVSSSARAKYDALTMEGLKRTGLVFFAKDDEPRKRARIYNPDFLMGVAKEAGEVEYSCATLSVAVRVPKGRIVFATLKGRAVGPSWSVLEFDGSNLIEAKDDVLEEIVRVDEPKDKEEPKRRRKKQNKGTNEEKEKTVESPAAEPSQPQKPTDEKAGEPSTPPVGDPVEEYL